MDVEKIAILPEYLIKRISKLKPTTEDELLRIFWLNKEWVSSYQSVVLDIIKKYIAGEVKYYSDYVRKTPVFTGENKIKSYVMSPNQRRKKWDQLECDKILKEYKSGNSIKDIGGTSNRSELEVGLQLINLFLKESQKNNSHEQEESVSYNSPGIERRGFRWSVDEDETTKSEYESGISFMEIAKKHQRTLFSIVCRLVYLGVDAKEIIENVRMNKESNPDQEVIKPL